MSIKTAIIFASSLAALPIAILLIGSAVHRKRRNSTLTREFLKQPKSTIVVNNSVDRVTTHGQQPEEISPWPLPTPSQRSGTSTANRTKESTIISTKSIPNPDDTPMALASPIVPSSTPDSDVIVSHQTSKEDETSLSDQSKVTGESLRELIVAAVKEARDSAKETGYRVKERTINISATVDSKDIRSLEYVVHTQVDLFEKTMSAIRKEGYDNQIKLLDSYKEFLQKQIKVIHARSKIARRLKRGS